MVSHCHLIRSGTGERVQAALLATGLACYIKLSVFVRLGLPAPWLMRGDIDDPTFRCLSCCWAQPSGLLCLADGSVSYFMATSPVDALTGKAVTTY